ncbi:MAG: hypothetical protein LBG59_06870 [Candidatus Peribacteria bacterium]|nr:hypothetical protein [Candidatus Peribacteria bacterium]
MYVRDDNSNSEYVEFNVNGSSYNTLNISTNRSAPSTDQWVNVTVNTESSYRGRTEFYVQYRSSSSSSWSTVSSSSYFTADSYLTNGYRFTSSDYGSHTFSSFIKFNRNGYFRLYVRDDNSNSEYVEFNVNGSSYNTLNISTNRSTPSTNQWVNITIETDSSYRDYVYFSLEYRDGSTRRSASTSYYEADNYFNRGYLFSSSDRGYITLNSFIRFNRTYLYRLYVEDRNGNSRYVEFDVGGNNGGGSNVDGFSTIELRKITNVSNIRNSVIAELKRNSYSLRNDSYWQRLSDTLYTNMRDVVNNRNSRTFAYYSDFLSAFNERYKYTARNA